MILARAGKRYDVAVDLYNSFGEKPFASSEATKVNPKFIRQATSLKAEGVIRMVQRAEARKSPIYRLTPEAIERLRRYREMGY